jgi:hypothetical protein
VCAMNNAFDCFGYGRAHYHQIFNCVNACRNPYRFAVIPVLTYMQYK